MVGLQVLVLAIGVRIPAPEHNNHHMARKRSRRQNSERATPRESRTSQKGGVIGMTKRDFLTNSALGMFGAAVLRGDTRVNLETEEKPAHPETMEEELPPETEGEVINVFRYKGLLANPRFTSPDLKMTKREIADHIKRVSPLFVDGIRKQGHTIPEQVKFVHEISMGDIENVYYEGEPTEFIERSKEHMQDAMDFWFVDGMRKPEISFEAPSNLDEHRALYGEGKEYAKGYAEDQRVMIHIIKDRINSFEVKSKPNIEGVEDIMNHFRRSSTSAGETTAIMGGRGEGDDIWLRVRRPPIEIFPEGPTSSEVDRTVSTPAELLHTIISEFTNRICEEEMIKGKSTEPADTYPIFKKNVDLEEAVVHAVTEIWLEHYVKKHKMEGSDSVRDHNLARAYPGMTDLLDHFPHTKEGAQEILKLFISDPEKIRELAGLNSPL